MRNILSRIKLYFEVLSYKRNFYINKILHLNVPAPLLHYLPHGFTVHSVAGTKLCVVDNFCTFEEAQYLASKVREQLGAAKSADSSAVASAIGMEPQKSVVLNNWQNDKNILSIIARGAMLAGVSTEHAEQLRVHKCSSNASNSNNPGFDVTLSSNCLCTILLFLSDSNSDQPDAIRFKNLNIAVRPRIGRAVFCPNWNRGNMTQVDAPHVMLSSTDSNGVGKWVIELRIQPYPIHLRGAALEPLQTRSGVPLEGSETLPAGTWIPAKSK